MKKRYLYSILFGIPGLLVSLIISFVVFGVVAGFLWIYIFGDQPWSPVAEKILAVLSGLVFFSTSITCVIIGYRTGKKLEPVPGLNMRHVMISACAVIAPVLLIVLHQWSVGNIGQKSDILVCSEYCFEKGFSSSGMPPKDSGDRSCICFDDSGMEVERVQLESIISRHQSK